ncbi:ATP-dependent DNA helicase DinG [Bacillus sp. V5-8f]|uniref:ATP-dependent DNA helicase DinG n=1 Tax=Bacillus sp. V5-8f TaxID=2053044 RepID=UPI000C78289A|nr:ATP-dependent DNA helicase DinG [Bacillus sp. V5-8f]PLT34899.1 ATP-dependent helicase DinG [Bacillus sp. V5-8f]
MAQRYAVIDLETTGNSSKKGDRVIQFAGVAIEDGIIVEEFSTFIRPGQDIPVFIEELTGITNEMVKDAPEFQEVASRIVEFLRDSCFVAHNVLFDLSFLQDELIRCGFEGFYGSAIDTVELAKITKPTSDGYKLNQLAKQENLQHDRPHRADSDAYVTALLFLELNKKLAALPLITLKKLHKLSFSLKSDISDLLEELMSEKTAKNEVRCPDLNIFRGIALRKSIHEDGNHHVGISHSYPFDHAKKAALMQTAILHMEYRQQQFKMMDLVYESFHEGRHTIIEAGTGIGKSLGYLVPAAFFAKHHGKTVLISTHTIQLQNQLIHQEIPKLKVMLPFDIHTVLLKGRGNYLSLAKFERALREKDDNYETALAKMQILVWLTETETGDKDELNLTSGGKLFWERIQSGGYIDPELLQPWSSVDYYERATRLAQKADFIITNHAYLASGFLEDERMKPVEGFVILDEAQYLEQAASKYLGSRLDYISVKTLLNRLGTYEQKLLLYKLEKLVRENKLKGLKSITILNEALNNVIYDLDHLFYLLAGIAEKHLSGEGTGRMAIQVKEKPEWRQVTTLVNRMNNQLHYFIKELVERLDALKQKDSLGKNPRFFIGEFEMKVEQLREIELLLKEFFIDPTQSFIYTMSYVKSAPHHGLSLSSQPITAGAALWGTFVASQNSVVMTSAILSAKNSFQFFKTQLGIEDMDIKTRCLPSPFDYSNCVKGLIASDMPDINAVPLDEFVKGAARHIISATKAAHGRVVIIFDSDNILRKTYQYVKDLGELEEFTMLAQGITGGSKLRMLRNFQSFEKALLFGKTSLWEGIEIPRDNLSCLVFVGLPFSPPDEPATEAKCLLIAKQGKNPFLEYLLPEAIFRVRQGFDQLVRSRHGKGVLLLLDPRISTAGYGKEFMEAIPGLKWEEVSLHTLERKIEEWSYL